MFTLTIRPDLPPDCRFTVRPSGRKGWFRVLRPLCDGAVFQRECPRAEVASLVRYYRDAGKPVAVRVYH